MITFRTKSGSLYEVDESNQLIRQLYRDEKLPEGSKRLASGEWNDYYHIDHRGQGSYLHIWFENNGHPVVTSKIVEVVGCSISD